MDVNRKHIYLTMKWAESSFDGSGNVKSQCAFSVHTLLISNIDMLVSSHIFACIQSVKFSDLRLYAYWREKYT